MKVTREEFDFMLGRSPGMHRAGPGERGGGRLRPTDGPDALGAGHADFPAWEN